MFVINPLRIHDPLEYKQVWCQPKSIANSLSIQKIGVNMMGGIKGGRTWCGARASYTGEGPSETESY